MSHTTTPGFRLHNGVVWTPSSLGGVTDFYAQFSAAQHHVAISQVFTDLDVPGSFTIEGWARVDFDSDDVQTIFRKINGSFDLKVYNQSGTFVLFEGSSFSGFTFAAPYGTPFYLSVVYDSTISQITVYVDGVLVLDTPLFITQDVGPIFLGADDSTGLTGGLSGLLDEFRVYTRAIGASEIAQHAANVFVNDTGLVFKVSFIEGDGVYAFSHLFSGDFISLTPFLPRPAGQDVDEEFAVYNEYIFIESILPTGIAEFATSDGALVSNLPRPHQNGDDFVLVSGRLITIAANLFRPAASFTVVRGNNITIDSVLHAPRGSQNTFVVKTGEAARLIATLPMQTFYADHGIFFETDLPLQLAQFQIENAALIAIDGLLRAPRVHFDAQNDSGIGSSIPGLNVRLLVPRVSFTLMSENFVSFAAPLLRPTARFTAVPGRIMELVAALPFDSVGGFSACMYGPYLITIEGNLPRPQLEMQLKSAIAEMWRCWVMNARHKDHPLTEYDNFHFNSMALFDGKIFAAGPDGLFVLGLEGDDDGTKIPAKIKTGEEDYDQSMMIRVPRIYVGGSSERGMEFRTIVTDNGTRVYRLPQSSNDAIQQRRVPVGRGPKSRYWQFEVRNIDGGDMTLESIIIYPEQTTRRVK